MIPSDGGAFGRIQVSGSTLASYFSFPCLYEISACIILSKNLTMPPRGEERHPGKARTAYSVIRLRRFILLFA